MLTLHLDKGIKTKRINKLIRQIIASPEKELTIYIDCTGGEVETAKFFHGFLTTCGKTVITCVIGNCCSSAMLIAIAGEERWAVPTARFMIHEPFDQELPGGIQAYIAADDENVVILPKEYDEIIKAAQIAKAKLQVEVSEYYRLISEHSNLTSNKIRKHVAEAVDNDWFFSAKEAVRLGIIENIGTPAGAAAEELKASEEP